MSKVLIIGGGAAGMMASIFAAEKGHEVHIYEQNEKLGKKVYITGKGRCNVTNACEDVEELIENVVSNSKFLYSAFYSFTNYHTMESFEKWGVPLKIERGNRVFPKSDHSSDIIKALEGQMKKNRVRIHLHSKVEEIIEKDGVFTNILLEGGSVQKGDGVIVATGGISYPSTGSRGDGYKFARAVGHQIVEPTPSLVSLLAEESYVHGLQGLSLRNVTFSIYDREEILYREFGEMLFTHSGVTGPIVLSASAHIGNLLHKRKLRATIDLKPALTAEQLDKRLLREFQQAPNKQVKNVISSLYPSSLIDTMIMLARITPEKPIHEVTKEDRDHIVAVTKAFPFTLTGTGEFKEAIITRGGVSVKDVNPSTMESKIIKGLYFAGEVLDLDAVTGGYNLQIAWSTGYLAATSIP